MTDRKSVSADPDEVIEQFRQGLERRVASRKAPSLDTRLLSNGWAAAQAHGRLAGVRPASPVANEEVIDCPVFRYAASTPAPPDSPIRKVPAQGSLERFILTQSRLIGGGAVSLMFKAEQESIARYLGAHVTLSIGARLFDLGAVNAAGVARHRVEGDIADSAHCVVHIRKPRSLPT